MRNYCQLVFNKNGTYYTWAVRWYASWLWTGGYALFPSHSLIQNVGFDNSGDPYDDRYAEWILRINSVRKEVMYECFQE